MARSDGGFGFFSASSINKQILLSIFTLLLAANCFAQATQTDATSHSDSTMQASSRAPDDATITIPAGTRLPLVLTYPVDSKSTRDVHAQTTAPVVVDGKVAIPAGTFVQGKVEKLGRHGTRAEMELKPASLVFADGYVATVSSAIDLRTDKETAWTNPTSASKAGIALAPVVGLGIGAGIGAAVHTTDSTTFAGQTITSGSPRGLAIGSFAGLAAGSVVSIVLLVRNHHFYVEVGSPLEASLPEPVTLSQAQISEAVAAAATQPVPAPIATRAPPPIPQIGSPTSGPASCTAGQDWCRGECVDDSAFLNDSSNCGRCGNSCSINESCTGGSCGCAPGYESCMGQCVSSASFISDSSNCGRCGNFCGAGESCFGGTCRKF
jgi:hypothetical protein